MGHVFNVSLGITVLVVKTHSVQHVLRGHILVLWLQRRVQHVVQGHIQGQVQHHALNVLQGRILEVGPLNVYHVAMGIIQELGHHRVLNVKQADT